MCDLNNPIFKSEDKARQHLERLRWPDGPVCPHCGAMERMAKIETESARPGLYYCNHCTKQYTVTVGTVFERSHVPLNKWVLAFHLVCASKKGMSSKQIERMLGVTYKTAWFMTHRIREAMKPNGTGFLGSGGGTVEVDETFWGNNKRSKKSREYSGRGYEHKMKVFSLVERGGKVRSFHVPAVNAKTLKPIIEAQMSKEAHLMTDDAGQYRILGPVSASHEAVAHSRGEYARGTAHTNTVEGYFSLLKRGLIGTFHHVGEQHLQRYVNEFDFRYNHRETRVKVEGKWEKAGFSDTERTIAALKGISGKRLTYRRANETA